MSSLRDLIVFYIIKQPRGDDTFTAVDSTIFNPVYDGELTLGDLDGDGDLDISVLGNFRGQSGGQPTVSADGGPVETPSRLDVLTGDYLAVYLNKYGHSVTRPAAPSDVLVTSNYDTLFVSFDMGADEETPAEGLTYNLRVRPVGWEGGYIEVFPAGSDSITGVSYLAANGLISGSRSWAFHSVPDGNYWVSVQAVDAGFQTSEFSEEILITVNQAVPVVLATFNVAVTQQTVTLNWTTRTETANAGFNIQRQIAGDDSWQSVGFVQGNGTTTDPRTYQFSDKPGNGSFRYRLEQVDLDGSVNYSSVLEVVINKPAVFALEQNYPNPFNPSTRINYSIATPGQVNLSLYDVLGRKVQELVNEQKPAGSHFFDLDARQLSSGVYFYRLESGSFSQIRKMTLVK